MQRFAALLTTLCALPFLAAQDAAAAPPKRPNIVWLTVEDMSPWLPCYGDTTVATPNLDRLAAQSLRFEHAYANTPVCAPARSTLITGVYATRSGAMHMRNNAAGTDRDHSDVAIPAYEAVPPAFVRCFPETLRAHGYYCTNNNKKDYQFVEPACVWDESSAKAHWRNRADGQPFFAVFNHNGTHESHAFPTTKRSPRVVDPSRVPLPPFYPDTPAVRDAVARTYDNIAAMDAWVGRQLQELEDACLLEDTIVMFFSDHGVGLPRGKRSCYDTGLRIPLLVRMPDGQGAATVETRVVSFVDFAPTVLSLAGIAPDQRLDGVPFLGAHRRDGTGLAFCHADRFDTVYDQVRGVSDGRYRLVRNLRPELPHLIRNEYRERIPMTADLYLLRQAADAPAAAWQFVAAARPTEELYDSDADPWEVVNLADDPALADVRRRLGESLDAWVRGTDDLGMVLPETELVRTRIWPPDGLQPTTPAARAERSAGTAGTLLSLHCDEPGASIAYRLVGAKSWTVYTVPFLAPAADIEVLTHRIGHRPTIASITANGDGKQPR